MTKTCGCVEPNQHKICSLSGDKLRNYTDTMGLFVFTSRDRFIVIGQ
jgi:hypothetical protein